MEEEKIAQGTYDFRNMRKDGYADALDAGVPLPR